MMNNMIETSVTFEQRNYFQENLKIINKTQSLIRKSKK
ncbi:hypothetical protein BG20_I0640 [Candidatus Nitrosarchaeum limnium BG20]|uniref:Uncharacterized protein n=1 Tax=Candidatus Nitrosarchaeum limnium BG20 TaxID=859192 RepID=S2EV06_9ARCH|nr:hypothetical protein BG20_I0640 [Candidatus Nitrosarchaeum limnium BG20]